MKEKSWTFIDKTDWVRGEWDDEPDKVQWLDTTTKLPCLIHRGTQAGALCGYVGVTKEHPCFEKGYDDVHDMIDIGVHGGLAFVSKCNPEINENGRGICHVVEDGEDDNVWWLGFDCGHNGDLCPSTQKTYGALGFSMEGEVYRNIAYVKQQIESLAKQLYEMGAYNGN